MNLRKSVFFFRFIVWLLITGFVWAPTSMAIAKDKFSIQQDGLVQVDDLQFANLNDYVMSDYFRENGKRCGTKTPPVSMDSKAARSVNDCTFYLTRIQEEYWSPVSIVIPVWFHVIYNSSGTGNISDDAISDQIQVLNEDFTAKTGTMGAGGYNTKVRFFLAGITRTQNDSWFDDDPGYTAALGKDPSKYVNVYTNSAGSFLGVSTFPQTSAGQENDGIVMLYQAIGGRNNGFEQYDQGRTLVHEMGHYLGLFHTFDEFGSCVNTYSGGDLIVDTPAENTPHFHCVQTSTCNSLDPIRNYMNYTPDSCMTEFTEEQANRLVCSLLNYRPDLLSGSIVPNVLVPLLLRQ